MVTRASLQGTLDDDVNEIDRVRMYVATLRCRNVELRRFETIYVEWRPFPGYADDA